MADCAASPRVSIGLPVFNGERYLRTALESILAQTFGDFELVVSDNGSTDGTQEICEEFAALDSRVRYVRFAENRGATWNFNQVATLCNGPYFKWAAHDDVIAPTYLEKCVAVLDADPTVCIAHAGVASIDETGATQHLKWRQIRAPQPTAAKRYRSVLSNLAANPEVYFGVIRRSMLDETRGLLDYAAADKTLLCELALRGRFVEVPEVLFFNRDHPERSVRAEADPRLRAGWFDPSNAGKVGLPYWRLVRDCTTAVSLARLPAAERWRCRLELRRLVWHMRSPLLRDPFALARHQLGRGKPTGASG